MQINSLRNQVVKQKNQTYSVHITFDLFEVSGDKNIHWNKWSTIDWQMDVTKYSQHKYEKSIELLWWYQSSTYVTEF